MPMRFHALLPLILAALLSGCASPDSGAVSDWGPFYYRGVTVHGHQVAKAAGPLWERKEDAQGRTFEAWRPLYAKSFDPHARPGKWLREYVWPLACMRGHGNERSGWFLTAVYMRDDVTNPLARRRLWVLPFYFGGRDREGRDYAAFFPLFGTIREFLTRDEIRFVLFPLWAHSRVKELETTSILWPFYSHSRGGKVYQRRVFPFWGVSRREGQYDKRFLLWPFWTEAEYFFRGARGRAWILFPFYGKSELEDQVTRWYMPPLFKIAEGNGNRRILAPWPFFQKSEGDVDKFYLFPLYGWKEIREEKGQRVVRRSFCLWPAGIRLQVDSPGLREDNRMVIPFYFDQTKTWSDPANAAKNERNLSIWPLFSNERTGGDARLRAPDFWPGKNFPGIERNWAPLWTLYHRETHGTARETEILWGMYRNADDGKGTHHWSVFPLAESSTAPDERGWQVLKGLAGWSNTGGKKKLKLLWFIHIPAGSESP